MQSPTFGIQGPVPHEFSSVPCEFRACSRPSASSDDAPSMPVKLTVSDSKHTYYPSPHVFRSYSRALPSFSRKPGASSPGCSRPIHVSLRLDTVRAGLGNDSQQLVLIPFQSPNSEFTERDKNYSWIPSPVSSACVTVPRAIPRAHKSNIFHPSLRPSYSPDSCSLDSFDWLPVVSPELHFRQILQKDSARTLPRVRSL